MPNQGNKSLGKNIVAALVSAIGPGPATLHEPSFDGNEWRYLKECLDSTYVSSVGNFVDEFEQQLILFTGAKYAVAMVNGTAALHIALLLAGVKPNDEVLIPALTFVATANAVSYCGAIPHFIDSEIKSFGIDAAKLRSYLRENTIVNRGLCINKTSQRVIKALVPMHVFGHPCNLSELLDISKEFNIALVEDAAESLGSHYDGRHTGTFGIMGVLSFNGNKTITTGGGGALLTNHGELAKLAKHLSTTAKRPHAWEYNHDSVGYNYRMPNLNAALGCAQLENLPELLNLKRKLALSYVKAFSGVEGCIFKTEEEGCKSNYWLQTIVLNSASYSLRNEILREINECGFMARPAWNLLNTLKHFENMPRMNLSGAEDLEKRIINIPSSPKLAKVRNA